MSFRPGQSGAVQRKGKRWIGRFYKDVPGSSERKRTSVTLGSVTAMTKSEARRKLRSMLEEMGLNDNKHLERIINTRTFRQEAEWWRDNKMSLYKPSVQETMGSHLDKYLIPRLGDVPLEQLTERRVQEFVSELSRAEYVVPNKRKTRKRLSPKSVRNIVGVLKLVLGKKVWRDWSIVLPEIPRKEQRYFTEEEMHRIIDGSKGQWRVLFATLALTGLRAGEAFGLHVEDLDLEAGTITVRRSVWNGEEVTPKTKSGYRVVHIDPVLSDLLREHLNGRRGGRVFQTRTGTPLSKGNVRRKLHETLRALGIPLGGLHAFRHGRVSVLQSRGVPGDLIKEWVGHSNLHTTSRYTHFDDGYKRRVARSLSLGMEEKLPDGPHGPRFRDSEGFSESH
jgi:integrase